MSSLEAGFPYESEPAKFADRYVVQGITDGGRKLVIIVQYKGARIIRPITAWDDI